MELPNKSLLDYSCTLIEENKVLHYFKLFGKEQDVVKLAKQKATELNGSYLITVNNLKTSINVIITCLTNEWEATLTNPFITTTIKGLNHAQ